MKLISKSPRAIFQLGVVIAALVIPLMSLAGNRPTTEAILAGVVNTLFIGFLVNFPFYLLGQEITLVQVVALGAGLIYGGSTAIWGMTGGYLIGALVPRLLPDSPLPHQTLKNLSWYEIAFRLGMETIPLAVIFYGFRWETGLGSFGIAGNSELPGLRTTIILIPLAFTALHTFLFSLRSWLEKGSAPVNLRQDAVSLLIVEILPQPFIYIAVAAYPEIKLGSLAALGGIPSVISTLMYGMSTARVGLERRVQELSTITNIGQMLRSTLELEPILETIHEQVTKLLGVESFYVAMYDAENQQIWYPLAVKNNERQNWRPRQVADRLTDRVILESKSVMLPRQARESLPGIGLSYGEEALNAWLGVPLITPQRTIGCLAVLSASPEAEFTPQDQNLLMILSGQISTAIDNALLYQQAQTRYEQLENLNQISRLITANLNLKEVLAKVCKAVIQVGGGQQSAIYLLNPESGEVSLAYSQGLSVEFVQTSYSFSVANNTRTRCLRTGQPFLVNDIQKADLDDSYQSVLSDAHILALGDFPLTTPDGEIGFLSVYFDAPHKFPIEQVELLQTFASQAALAVSNARLHAQTDQALSRRVHQLSILEAVGRELSAVTSSERLFQMILDYALEFTNSTWGSVMQHDAANHMIEIRVSKGYKLPQNHYPDHVGLIGRVLRLYTAVNVGDVSKDMDYVDLSGGRARSQLVVPMFHESRVLGVISIESPKLSAFDDNDQAFLMQLANQAAIALVNASLYEETQRRLREQSSLYLISSKLVGDLTMESVSQTIVQAIASTIEASLAGLYLWETSRDAYRIRAQIHTSYLQEHVPLPELIPGGQLRADHPKLQITNTLRVYQTHTQLIQHLNLCQDCRALLIPLTMSGEHFGIVVLHTSKNRKVTDEEMQLAQTVAAQGSIAIQNARLFDDVTQGRDRLQAVLNSVEEGIMMVNPEGNIILANEQIGELINTPLDSSRETPLLNLPEPALHSLGYSVAQAADLVRILSQGLIPAGAKTIVHRKEPVPEKVLECSTAPVWGQSDRAIGIIIVIRDITEQHEINQARELLTQTVVHDLKSPMTAITSALALIEETAYDPIPDTDIIEQSISIANRAAQRILSLVEALLDIARMESGKMGLELSQIEPVDLLEQVSKDFMPQARSIGVVLQTNVAHDLPSIRADVNKITRVFANLLDNALKFTPTGGQVVLSAEQINQKTLQVQVVDSGPGIPAEFREKIFDRFSQVPGQKGRQRGSGLGLTFCKLVVEAHGGRIWVEANPVGGSLFCFTLPVAGPMPDPDQAILMKKR